MKGTIAFGFMSIFATSAFALECRPTTYSACDASGCVRAPQSINRIVIDQRSKLVTRCDKNGCDQVPVEISTSGAMIKIGSIERGYLLIVNKLDGSFSEVASQLTALVVKSGTCK
jgi:hypothetical protein